MVEKSKSKECGKIRGEVESGDRETGRSKMMVIFLAISAASNNLCLQRSYYYNFY